MQGVLLYLIFDEVVVSNMKWQNGVMKLGGKGDHVAALFTEVPSKCNDGGALCFHDKNGMYTCAPPSIQLTGRWDELDSDGDGVWTRKEVMAARDDLKCKYAVDPVEVFDVLVNMLLERESLIWLHPDVKSGQSIHHPYFTYAMADLVMCGYRSKEMCANIVERGFFHAPLKHGTAPRVGTTIDSALKYCYKLLEPGGTCERLLPSTYTVWKVQSQIECGDANYQQFRYVNPGSGVTKSLLSVDYSAREEYKLAQNELFKLFKGIMIFSWLLLVAGEYRDIIKVLTLCGRMPDARDFGDDAVLREQDPSDPEDVRYRIQGITTSHRRIMVAVSLLRAVVTFFLMWVGVSYLIKTNGYADLIMNGVTLIFIAEVSSVLYSQVLRDEVKDQTEDIKSIKVEMYGIDWLNRRPALVDILCVFGMLVAVWIIMDWQSRVIVLPVYNALECTCLSSGEHCVEAQKYNYDFWHNYWMKAVPDIFTEVDKLKASRLLAAVGSHAGGATEGGSRLLAAVGSHAGGGEEALEERLDRLERTHDRLEEQLEELE